MSLLFYVYRLKIDIGILYLTGIPFICTSNNLYNLNSQLPFFTYSIFELDLKYLVQCLD